MPLTWNQKRGPLLVSTATKSTLPFPVIYTKDIDGCGSKDHVVSSVNFDLKSRPKCGVPSSFLSVSIKSIRRRLDNENAPFALYKNIERLLDYAYDAIENVGPQSVADIDAGIDGENPSKLYTSMFWEDRGQSYYLDAGEQDIYRLSKLYSIPVYDKCGLIAGYKVPVNYSLNGIINPDECRVGLKESISATVFFGSNIDDSLVSAFASTVGGGVNASEYISSRLNELGLTPASSPSFTTTGFKTQVSFDAQFGQQWWTDA